VSKVLDRDRIIAELLFKLDTIKQQEMMKAFLCSVDTTNIETGFGFFLERMIKDAKFQAASDGRYVN